MASTHKVWVEIAYDSCWWLSHKRDHFNLVRNLAHLPSVQNQPTKPAFSRSVALYSRTATGQFSMIFRLILENRVSLAKLHHLSLEDPADQWLWCSQQDFEQFGCLCHMYTYISIIHTHMYISLISCCIMCVYTKTYGHYVIQRSTQMAIPRMAARHFTNCTASSSPSPHCSLKELGHFRTKAIGFRSLLYREIDRRPWEREHK